MRRRRVAMREMETDFHMTLSPVTGDPVGSDTDFPVAADPVTVDPVTADPVTVDPVVVDTECSLSPEQMLLLHTNPILEPQDTSFHL